MHNQLINSAFLTASLPSLQTHGAYFSLLQNNHLSVVQVTVPWNVITEKGSFNPVFILIVCAHENPQSYLATSWLETLSWFSGKTPGSCSTSQTAARCRVTLLGHRPQSNHVRVNWWFLPVGLGPWSVLFADFYLCPRHLNGAWLLELVPTWSRCFFYYRHHNRSRVAITVMTNETQVSRKDCKWIISFHSQGPLLCPDGASAVFPCIAVRGKTNAPISIQAAPLSKQVLSVPKLYVCASRF